MPNAFRVGRMISSGTSAATPIQLVSPDENRTGLVLRTGHIWVVGGTMFMVAEKTQASSYATALRTVFSVSSSAGARVSQEIPYPLYIDPGFGVYMFCTPTVTDGFGLVSYDFVDGFENA